MRNSWSALGLSCVFSLFAAAQAFGNTAQCLNVDGCIYNIPGACQSCWDGDLTVANMCTSVSTCMSIPCLALLPSWQVSCGTSTTTSTSTQTSTGTSTSTSTFTATVTTTVGACTKAAQLVWDPTNQIVKWCDGTNWQNPSVTASGNCPSTEAGKISYAGGILSYCDGNNVISMKGPGVGSCSSSKAGQFLFDGANKYFKYCDGSSWYEMIGGTSPSTPCGGYATCTAYCAAMGSPSSFCAGASGNCQCGGIHVRCSPSCVP